MIGERVGWGLQWSFGRGDLVQVLQVIPLPPLPGYGVGEEEVRARWRGIRAFWREPVIQRTHRKMYLWH